jgi:hypothetical protein
VTATDCTTSDDCVLATRIDVCCPECQEAFAAVAVAQEECLYAGGEPNTTSCTPDECPDGCPGTACAEAVDAVCIGGQCRVAVSEELCDQSTCDAGEFCVDFDGSYACLPENCAYDRCHPERCDQVGERCCDPFPGDGVSYCNEGLECGISGCQVPEGVDAERVCGNVLCAVGAVCCDQCLGTCVAALSGAYCPNDNASGTDCGDAFACGPDLSCSRTTQYCESLTSGPIPDPVYTCNDAPEDCSGSLSCACLAEAAPFGRCSATPDGGLVIEESAP